MRLSNVAALALVVAATGSMPVSPALAASTACCTASAFALLNTVAPLFNVAKHTLTSGEAGASTSGVLFDNVAVKGGG